MSQPGVGDRGSGGARKGPPPDIVATDALLLDFDGTLIELADTPDSVHCPPYIVDLLSHLMAGLGGAIAVISGRSLRRIDEFLKPLVLAGAGVHGAEIRLNPCGPLEALEVPEVAELAQAMGERFMADPRINVENKRSSVAVHFRLAPEREAECRLALEAHAACPPFRIIEGKFVVEARPAEVDKGTALVRLMAARPFEGRRPVVVGDDHSDEAAFAAALTLGGYGVKVGAERTAASYRLGSVSQVLGWLRAASERIMERGQ